MYLYKLLGTVMIRNSTCKYCPMTQCWKPKWKWCKHYTFQFESITGIHPRVLRELLEVLTKLLSISYPSLLASSKCDIHLQEGGLTAIQVCQSDLSARQVYGADHLECHCVAHIGQTGDQAQSALDLWNAGPAWLTWSPSTKKVTLLVDEGKSVDVV